MKLRITITVQGSDLPEIPVFESDLVSPGTVYSMLAIAEQTAGAQVRAAAHRVVYAASATGAPRATGTPRGDRRKTHGSQPVRRHARSFAAST